MFIEVHHQDGVADDWINSDHIVSVHYRADYGQYNVALSDNTERQVSGSKAMSALEAALGTSPHPRSPYAQP